LYNGFPWHLPRRSSNDLILAAAWSSFCLWCQIMGLSCAQAILAFSLGCWVLMRSLESQGWRFPPPRGVEDSFHPSLKIMAFGDARLPLCLDLAEVVWFWYSSPYHSRTDLDRVQYSRRFSRSCHVHGHHAQSTHPTITSSRFNATTRCYVLSLPIRLWLEVFSLDTMLSRITVRHPQSISCNESFKYDSIMTLPAAVLLWCKKSYITVWRLQAIL